MTLSRRQFLKTTAGTSLLFGISAGASQDLHSARPTTGASAKRPNKPDVAVIGAGIFGLFTALYLQRLGASVAVIDMYGPGNSRSTSGDETRGVKSSYGSRPFGLQWAAWATEATDRWMRWDEEWRDKQHPRLFFLTGDLVLRPQLTPSLKRSVENWNTLGIPFEIIEPEDLHRRFPQINSASFGVGVFEPGAGVIRSRRALEATAEVFESEGGTLIIDQALPPSEDETEIGNLRLASGASISAAKYVFACGPWLPKALPVAMGRRLRTPMGNVYYFGTPPGDLRFNFPNFPCFNVPGGTGWPALGRDNRGFRLRTGGKLDSDPDTSDRSIPLRSMDEARSMLAKYFPDLADAPLLEMRSTHFDYSSDSNFIIDQHPSLQNAWIVGGGSAEGFKFGPVVGEYLARRLLGHESDRELAAAFALKDLEFGEYPQPKEAGWLDRKIEAYCRDRL